MTHVEERRTTCSRDCPDACGIVATVEDGQVVAMRGDPDHPVTRGFLCYRTSNFVEQQRSKNRLTQPLLRKGGELVPVSMDEALDVAAQRLLQIREESGPAAIFHYRSGGSLGLLKVMADRFFEKFGPCATKIGDICSGAGEAAQELDFGACDSNDLFDLLNGKQILLWGKNPFVSNIHLIPVLKDARKKGARLVGIDPVHHKGAGLCDEFMQPRPGGDLDLALGMARVLFDEGLIDANAADRCRDLDGFRVMVEQRTVAEYATAAQVDEDQLRQVATSYAAGPAAILVGWGMQRRRHGGAIVRALDALAAISGNLYRSGGGCSFYFARRSGFAQSDFVQGPSVAPRQIREPLLGADVLAATNPKVRCIWVTAGNPVSMLPDSATVARAFEETEFTVVVDAFMNDTARRADLVLPIPTLLEDDDVLGAYGHHWMSESRPVVPPPPGVLHELELLQALAARVGLAGEFVGSIDDHKRKLLAPVAEGGVTLESLREGPQRNPLSKSVLFADGRVHTEDGRVCLMTERPVEANGAETEWPLWLFSNSTEKAQASQWAGDRVPERTWVTVHPDVVPGRSAGDLVTVRNEHGQVQAELRLDDRQRRDVAIMPKGGHFDRGHSANALIAARATDIGLGAAYLDCRVRVE